MAFVLLFQHNAIFLNDHAPAAPVARGSPPDSSELTAEHVWMRQNGWENYAWVHRSPGLGLVAMQLAFSESQGSRRIV
jgi:hypothetical protein